MRVFQAGLAVRKARPRGSPVIAFVLGLKRNIRLPAIYQLRLPGFTYFAAKM
jgi:hypothetical protein